MKIERLAFLTIFLVGLNLNAQSDFTIGVKGGINYSGFNVEGSSAYTDAFGYHLGVIGEYNLKNNFALLTELNFAKKTGSRAAPTNLSGGTIKSDLNYIDIPLMGKYYLSKSFAIAAGPQLDFLINESTEINFYNGNEDVSSLDIKTNGLQLSCNLGFSYILLDKYIIQLRYSHGLSDVYQDLEAKNTVFSFSLGYFFL